MLKGCESRVKKNIVILMRTKKVGRKKSMKINIVLNNSNIREYARLYMTNKEVLPKNLQVINDWDVTQVTDMERLFEDFKNFNEPLNWVVSQVTNMSRMFYGCENFNQPLKWDVSQVTDMSYMFSGCKNFNQPLPWTVSQVTHMSFMFYGCENFNQPLNWTVDQVTHMNGLFYGCGKPFQLVQDMSGCWKVVVCGYI